MADHGAEAAADVFLEDDTSDSLAQKIAVDILSWIRLALLPLGGKGASASVQLGQSQGLALPTASDAMLTVLNISGCSVSGWPGVAVRPSFYEGDPTNVPQHNARAIGL